MKKILIGMGVFVLLSGIIIYVVMQNKVMPDKNIVGGDRDEHGCIGSAGYSWCAPKNKCLRIWEENVMKMSSRKSSIC